jgi:hypothetical protein
MTGSDIQQLLVTRLVKAHGGTRQRWRQAIGEVRVYSLDTHPQCNWDVRPIGRAADVDAINDLVDELRMRHSRVVAG